MREVKQLGNPLRGSRSLGDPIVDPLPFEAETLLLSLGHGVEKTHALNETAIALGLPIGNDHLIEGPFFGSPTSQPDRNHVWTEFEDQVGLF